MITADAKSTAGSIWPSNGSVESFLMKYTIAASPGAAMELQQVDPASSNDSRRTFAAFKRPDQSLDSTICPLPELVLE